MYRKIVVLAALQFCFLFVSKGQDSIPKEPVHLFGIYTGVSRHIIRDDVASPLIYSGSQAPLVFTYRYIGRKSRQSFTLYFDNLELKSSITDKSGYYWHYADNINAFLEYTYSRKAFTINPIRIDCFLGVQFLSGLNYRNHHFYNENSILFVEQLNSMGINFLMEKKIGSAKDDYLRLNVNVPIIAYAVLGNRYNAVVSETFDKIDFNKNVLGQVLTNGEIVTLNKLVAYQTKLSYAMFLTKHIGIEFEHRLHFYNFSHYKDLLHARSLSIQFLVGLIIKL